VTDPNRPIVAAAETLADRIFSSIRVKIQWHEPPFCPPSAENPIFMVIQTPTPEGHLRGALGEALPLEGNHAWVFYDRVRGSSPDDDHLLAASGACHGTRDRTRTPRDHSPLRQRNSEGTVERN
jgi:hypothetical protein